MRTLVVLGLILFGLNAYAGTAENVMRFAQANGFKPSKRVVFAIVAASKKHGINALELTSIGIVESGLGKYARDMANSNGTIDRGIFQINSVNFPKCQEYKLNTPEGSAMCAAKLLSEHKRRYKDYLGVYHSKTPSKKKAYLKKVTKILSVANR